uniref:Replication initiator 1 n=1 Tax=Neovison vison TaxID=452646 RepID=A0A8C7EJP3_NEOVI
MDARRASAHPAGEVRPGQGAGFHGGPRRAALPAGRVTVCAVRGRTHAGTALQGPPGHGSRPAQGPWALPEVAPDPGEGAPWAEVTRHFRGPVGRPSPQGPSLCPLPKALPGLGGPVASQPALPGPAAATLS